MHIKYPYHVLYDLSSILCSSLDEALNTAVNLPCKSRIIDIRKQKEVLAL